MLLQTFLRLNMSNQPSLGRNLYKSHGHHSLHCIVLLAPLVLNPKNLFAGLKGPLIDIPSYPVVQQNLGFKKMLMQTQLPRSTGPTVQNLGPNGGDAQCPANAVITKRQS